MRTIARIGLDGVRRVAAEPVESSQSSAFVERMGSHRKPAHLRPNRPVRPSRDRK